MKYYKQIGILACLLLVIGSLSPLAYYPDLHQSFTGFYSEKNMYGRPGKVFTFIAVVSVVLIFVNKIWAKRTLIFIAAINIGYLIKTYVVFTSCYNTICPEIKYGLVLLIAGTVLLMISALFPDMKLPVKPETEKNILTEE